MLTFVRGNDLSAESCRGKRLQTLNDALTDDGHAFSNTSELPLLNMVVKLEEKQIATGHEVDYTPTNDQ